MLELTAYAANDRKTEMNAVRTDPAVATMKPLTCCEINRTKVAGKAVRKALVAAPARKLLTFCQAKVARIGVKITRTTICLVMKSLTSCQAKGTRVGVKALRIHPALHAM